VGLTLRRKTNQQAFFISPSAERLIVRRFDTQGKTRAGFRAPPAGDRSRSNPRSLNASRDLILFFGRLALPEISIFGGGVIPLKCLKWAGSRGRHFHFPSTWCQIISPPWSSKGGVASCLGTFATVLGEGGMGVEEGDGLGEEGASFGSGVTHSLESPSWPASAEKVVRILHIYPIPKVLQIWQSAALEYEKATSPLRRHGRHRRRRDRSRSRWRFGEGGLERHNGGHQ
jgi:hypothetical protein